MDSPAPRVPDRSASEVAWRVPLTTPAVHLTVRAALFPYDPNHQTFVNLYEGDVPHRQDILSAQRPVLITTPAAAGCARGVQAFTAAGVHHIAIGPDHILFIVGLLLLGGQHAPYAGESCPPSR